MRLDSALTRVLSPDKLRGIDSSPNYSFYEKNPPFEEGRLYQIEEVIQVIF